nr:MAG TPA: hypothetical protein [Caudoviricetes sp.]DAO48605.1 MAG TPA: hypothetical protein [Caudoviricetes sp.]
MPTIFTNSNSNRYILEPAIYIYSGWSYIET